jgi:hypothetical protein
MRLARSEVPVITFINTRCVFHIGAKSAVRPGARGNILEMFRHQGADHLPASSAKAARAARSATESATRGQLENSLLLLNFPRVVAAILWKNGDKAPEAAKR